MPRPLWKPLLLASLLTGAPLVAHGDLFSSSTGGATIFEQIIQEATAVNQLTEAVSQTAQQIQMVMNQVRNLQSLPQQLWPNITSQMQNLSHLAGAAQGLTYASANTASQVNALYGNTSDPLRNYAQSLQQWTQNLNSQTASILNQYGMEAGNFANEQSALQSVQDASQTAVGRMQVLQAGNQISGMMVNQLQLLRSDMFSGNQVMMNALTNRANQIQQDRNNGEAWIKSNQNYQPTY